MGNEAHEIRTVSTARLTNIIPFAIQFVLFKHFEHVTTCSHNNNPHRNDSCVLFTSQLSVSAHAQQYG